MCGQGGPCLHPQAAGRITGGLLLFKQPCFLAQCITIYAARSRQSLDGAAYLRALSANRQGTAFICFISASSFREGGCFGKGPLLAGAALSAGP